MTKPEVVGSVAAKLSAPTEINPGQTFTYVVSVRNDSEFALNGTQVRFHIPASLTFAGATSDSVTKQGDEVVFTLSRLARGAEQTVEIPVSLPSKVRAHEV